MLPLIASVVLGETTGGVESVGRLGIAIDALVANAIASRDWEKSERVVVVQVSAKTDFMSK